MITTHNGAPQYEHSLNHALEFFSKAGSAYKKKKSFYGSEDTALKLFQMSWIANEELSMKLLLWLRDCRGGAGNRSGFRDCLKWLGTNDPAWVKANIEKIPDVGRWDDLLSLYDTPVEKSAVRLWANAIHAGHGLACKWADVEDTKLREFLDMRPRAFRKLLVKGRKVVETQMCAKNWGEILYPQVPSVAMSRYTKAFTRHDEPRFSLFKKKVEKGEAKINAGAIFPYDCLRTLKNGDREVAQLQWDALPNFMGDTNERILCLCDASGSMSTQVAGDVTNLDISTSLSLYCSDRLGKANPFYRKFIEFESEAHFIDWNGKSLFDALKLLKGHCGSTNIQNALLNILGYANMFDVKPSHMPTKLMIISDMQFDNGASLSNATVVESAMAKWEAAGYKRPQIIYWCLASYAGSPATVKTPNTALVSGFSPSILKAILGGKDFSPLAVMNRALEKYSVIKP